MDLDKETRKKVDENWKVRIENEKTKASDDKELYHEPNFTVFVSSLGMQAMIALGKLENPITKQTEKNTQQARYLIDTIGILKEKTKGNLTREEETLLDESLFSLRTIYIEEKETK